MSNLLINESPLKLLSSLAVRIGKSPSLALVLQKIHYEQSKSKEEVYLVTYPKLHERIPFISKPQLKRIIVQLVNEKLIYTTKSKNQMLGSQLIINYEKLLKWGFKCTDDGSIVDLINDEQPLLILPSIAKEFGISAAGIIQQLYFKIKCYDNESIWLTYSEINKWAAFICPSQMREIFYKFEKNNLILSKLSDIPNDRSGKFYTVNHEEVNMKYEKPITNVSVDNSMTINDKHVDKEASGRSFSAPKTILPDHFRHPVEIISGTQLRSFPAPNSIDQRSKKIFKENNTNTLGRKPESGIIPKAKDDIVLLIERLMTYNIEFKIAKELVDNYGAEKIKYVISELGKRYKKVDPGLLIAALVNDYYPDKNSKGKEMAKNNSSSYLYYLERETKINNEKTDLMMKKRASNDVGESHLKILRSKLGRSNGR